MPPTGEIDVPLAEDEVEAGGRTLRQARHGRRHCRFLFSFLNNEHEVARKEIVQAVLPDAFVCCSLRGREHHPRIRALLHDRDERLYRSEDLGSISSNSKAGCARTASRRWCASCSRTAASRRSRIRLDLSDRPASLRPGRRRDRRALDRRQLRQEQHHHHRHRRHVGRHFGDPERRAADQEPARHRGRRACRCSCR